MINFSNSGLQFSNTNHVMLGIKPTVYWGTGALTASLLISIHEYDFRGFNKCDCYM